jgi:hypothetical protein
LSLAIFKFLKTSKFYYVHLSLSNAHCVAWQCLPLFWIQSLWHRFDSERRNQVKSIEISTVKTEKIK